MKKTDTEKLGTYYAVCRNTEIINTMQSRTSTVLHTSLSQAKKAFVRHIEGQLLLNGKYISSPLCVGVNPISGYNIAKIDLDDKTVEIIQESLEMQKKAHLLPRLAEEESNLFNRYSRSMTALYGKMLVDGDYKDITQMAVFDERKIQTHGGTRNFHKEIRGKLRGMGVKTSSIRLYKNAISFRNEEDAVSAVIATDCHIFTLADL